MRTKKLCLGIKNCLVCKKSFSLKIRRDIERKKFCSRKCLGSWFGRANATPENIAIFIKNTTTPEVNAKKARKRENHPRWIKDRSKLKNRPRHELNIWRKKVFERDDYICQICNKRGGKLQADHIKPYSLYPELREDLNNGRTLCIECHRKTDTYGIKFVHQVKKGIYGKV